jgi:hypothetical protein
MIAGRDIDNPDLERQFQCFKQDVDADRAGAGRHVEFHRHAACYARIMLCKQKSRNGGASVGADRFFVRKPRPA